MSLRQKRYYPLVDKAGGHPRGNFGLCRSAPRTRVKVKVVFLGFGAVKSGKRGLLHTNFSPFDYD